MLQLTSVWRAVPLVLALATPIYAQDEPSLETVVASVNGEEITLGHMLVIRARLPEQYANLPPEQLFNGILDQLVNQTLLSQQTEDLSSINNLIVENERRALLSSQSIARIAAEATTDDAIAARYDELAAEGGDPEFNASHILVETEEEALEVIAELEAGANFAELARERSTGPSGPNGGSLGWFGMGMMVPPFEAAVLELDPGGVSGPVETQFGWHVVTLNDRRVPEVPPLEEVRDGIVDAIQEEAIQAEIETLRASAMTNIELKSDLDTSLVNRFDLLTVE